MADDVDTDARRAAQAARSAANRPGTNLLSLLLLVLAVLSVALLVMTDRDVPQSGTQPQVEGPKTTQPGN